MEQTIRATLVTVDDLDLSLTAEVKDRKNEAGETTPIVKSEKESIELVRPRVDDNIACQNLKAQISILVNRHTL